MGLGVVLGFHWAVDKCARRRSSWPVVPPRGCRGNWQSGEMDRSTRTARGRRIIPNSVSVVVIAKDEEDNIAGCLQSLSQYEDIVVVDDYSTDRTADLAETFGARVVQHRFESFAKQRNWALEHLEFENEWILFLDADEHASPEFSSALLESAFMR